MFATITMKQGIHPKLYTDTRVVCSCGNSFTTSSTKQEIRVEVCYKCHPYFTGEHRFIDTKGRVDRFQKKQETAKQMKQYLVGTKKEKKKTEDREPKTLQELLSEM